MSIFNAFSNLKVSKKLYLGFAIVFLVTIIIVISAMIGLNDIQDKINKSAISSELNNDLTVARLSRTNYQYTYDLQYLEQNNHSLNGMMEQIAKLKKFKWSPQGFAALQRTESAVNNYMANTAPFINALNQKKSIQDHLNSQDLYKKSVLADKLSRNDALSDVQKTQVSQLGFSWNDIDSSLNDFKLKPGEGLEQTMQAR